MGIMLVKQEKPPLNHLYLDVLYTLYIFIQPIDGELGGVFSCFTNINGELMEI